MFEPTPSGSRQVQLGATAPEAGARLVVAIDPFRALSVTEARWRIAELAALGDAVLVLRTGNDAEDRERLAAFARYGLFHDAEVAADEPRIALLRRRAGLRARLATYERVVQELWGGPAPNGSVAILWRNLKQAGTRFVPADSLRARALDTVFDRVRKLMAP